MIREKDGAPDKALEKFRSAPHSTPPSSWPFTRRVIYWRKSGKFGGAAGQFKKVWKWTARRQAHFNIALAYRKSGDEATARPELKPRANWIKPNACRPISDSRRR